MPDQLMILFLGLINMLPIGILIINAKHIVFVNSQFFKQFDIENNQNEDAIISKFYSLIHTDTSQLEFTIQINDKNLLIIKSNTDDLKQIFVITDITAYKRLQISQIQEKYSTRLISMFMHEFRTPMNWLSGTLSSIVPNESTAHLLKISKHAMDLLNLYIDDIAFYSKSNESERPSELKKHFSVSKCIEECMSFVSDEISISQINCEYLIPTLIPVSVLGCPVRYKQILNNILCNSIKSCKPIEGEISVKLELVDNKLITIVTDNGQEMGKREIEMLMNPVSSIDNVELQVRYGIGMLLCRKMCQRCKGDFEATSAAGKNVYSFWIPVQGKQHSITTISTCISDNNLANLVSDTYVEQVPYNKELVPSHKKVLIVDDTAFNNIMLKNMLKLLNVECEMCSNGKEAIDIISDKANEFGLVFMDVNMPVMDGLQATKILTERNDICTPPIVMLSAQDDRQTINSAIHNGASGYIKKPLVMCKLREALSKFKIEFIPMVAKKEAGFSVNA